VDIESFSDVVGEATTEAEISTTEVETTVPQPVHPQDEASPEFARELGLTIHKGEDPIQDVPLLETHADLPRRSRPFSLCNCLKVKLLYVIPW
jgi:hypothetical protein